MLFLQALQGSHNFNSHVHTLYVTDYTRNEQMMGIQANWCPASLSEFVVQFEMWDGAATIAKEMQPGQYYSIKNARMVVNPKGFPEGKVRETKILQLTEDHTNPHLRALLELVILSAASLSYSPVTCIGGSDSGKRDTALPSQI